MLVILVCGVIIKISREKKLGNLQIDKEILLALLIEKSSLQSNSTLEINDEINLTSSEEIATSIDTNNWDLSKVDIIYDTEGVAVPVPKGYVASGADGEHTVNTGFVIYEGDAEVTNDNAWSESCNRNQWVWVPVPDASRIYTTNPNGKKVSKLYSYSSSNTARTSYSNSNYEPGILTSYDNELYFSRYKLQGMTRDKLLDEIQEEFEATVESIEKYGGFYIGRYESGGLQTKEAVVKRMQDTGNNLENTWYVCYGIMQNMGANENVKSSMIFGCLWDETLQWLIDSGNKTYEEIVDSTSWGNYSNATFEYTKADGTTATKASGSRTAAIPTGSTEYTNANNIYDLAGGSSWEWTLEGDVSRGRMERGGYYYYCTGSSHPASCRTYCRPNVGRGARAHLYIK